MGSSTRDGLYKGSGAPGPGFYSLKDNLPGPKYGFGSSKRDGLKKSDVPGPGTYNLKPKFADVPNYVFNGSPPKIHL